MDKQFKFLNKVKQVRVIHFEIILTTSYMVLGVIISDVTKPKKINVQKTRQNVSMCTRLRCTVVEKLGVRCK